MLGEVAQLSRRIGELENELARMRQDCDPVLGDVLYDPDVQQDRLDWTTLQLSGTFGHQTIAA